MEQLEDVNLAAGGGQAVEVKVVDVDIALPVGLGVLRAEQVDFVVGLGAGGADLKQEDLPKVFDRFFTSDQTRSGRNTGLGLAIVKHIVRSMNGEIEVHSKFGEGTEFLITLPLAPRDNPDKDTIFNDEL